MKFLLGLALALILAWQGCMVSSLRRATLNTIMSKAISSSRYPDCLREFYGINARLRKEGISAPQEESVINTRRLYDAIGKPLDSIPTLHVGGTNGKGTTSFKLCEVLKSNGIKTGLFVSPHLASFRERMQVNGELLPEEQFVENYHRLTALCAEHDIAATEFELTFLMAALHFKQSACEAVVLEVGLGGEYDATNVVNTAVGIICSVSLDHTRILGPTVEAIAQNKAGIFKPNRPALIGPGVPLPTVQAVARARGTHLYTYDQAYAEFEPKLWKHNIDLSAADSAHGVTSCPLVDTDALNANIALLGLHLLQKHHPTAFPQLDLTSPATAQALDTRPPCRWEEHTYIVPGTDCELDVILDMGHNPAALAALARRIAFKFPGRDVRVVYAMSRDKDVRTCLKNVLTVVPPSHIHFVQSRNWRAISREELSKMFKEETGSDMTQLNATGIQDTLAEVTQLLAQAQSSSIPSSPGDHNSNSSGSGSSGGSSGGKGVLVVCGTGYIMPEARAFLGIVEPRDEEDLKR